MSTKTNRSNGLLGKIIGVVEIYSPCSLYYLLHTEGMQMRLISVSFTNTDPEQGKVYWWTFEVFGAIHGIWTSINSKNRAEEKLRLNIEGE